MKLRVKVTAGAPEDGVSGWLGDTLKVRVRARREKGRANDALGRLLAATLGLQVDQVRVVSGLTSERKLVEITGADRQTVHDRLRRAAAAE